MPPSAPTLPALSGGQDATSDTFYTLDSFTVSWSASVENTDVDFGYFSVDLYSATEDDTVPTAG